MKRFRMLTDTPAARRRAFRLVALALTLLSLALALPAGASAGAPGAGPTISAFYPAAGPVGTVVTLKGSGFNGATVVELVHAQARFTVQSGTRIMLVVPAGAISGPISVTTAAGSAMSAAAFSVTAAAPVITVTAPTGTAGYVQGSSLTVSWTASPAPAAGEFGVWARSPAGGRYAVRLVPAGGGASFSTSLILAVPLGSGYTAIVAWRPSAGSGAWSTWGTSPGSFAVTTRPSPDAAKAISAFSFQGLTPAVTGTINEANHTIALTVPVGTADTGLVATFTTTGATLKVGATTQVSGTTPNDFTGPVTYTVIAADASTQAYVVTVYRIGKSYQGGKIAYLLQAGDPGYDADVVHGLIAATADQSPGIRWYNGSYAATGAAATELGAGLDDTNMIITQQGATATSYAAGVARAYTGGGYSDWCLPSKDELNKLYINRVAIGGLGSGFYWSSSEADAYSAWGQVFDSGAPGSWRKDTLSRVRAVRAFPVSTAKAITAFSFQGLTPAVTGTIDETVHTIALTVPYGTSVTALVATFTTSGETVKVGATHQVSGTTPNNFTHPVTYTVTAVSGTTQAYTVTVTFALSPAKAITAFSFQGLTPVATGVINESLHTIALSVPVGTSVSALAATFTTTGATVKVGATTQFSGTTPNDFTGPVTYTVTAVDASTQAYIVTVTFRPLAIGDAYGGGIIAYILRSGDPGYVAGEVHGLIAATADQSAGVWWDGGVVGLATGATATALGTGSANTTTIIAKIGTSTSYAARVARDYRGGGHTDWCLPSKDELNKLYLGRAAIGGFEGSTYWSSSESTADKRAYPLVAWCQDFPSGIQYGVYPIANKDGKCRVRAVRSF